VSDIRLSGQTPGAWFIVAILASASSDTRLVARISYRTRYSILAFLEPALLIDAGCERKSITQNAVFQ
jgi:hypothetical protein